MFCQSMWISMIICYSEMVWHKENNILDAKEITWITSTHATIYCLYYTFLFQICIANYDIKQSIIWNFRIYNQECCYFGILVQAIQLCICSNCIFLVYISCKYFELLFLLSNQCTCNDIVITTIVIPSSCKIV